MPVWRRCYERLSPKVGCKLDEEPPKRFRLWLGNANVLELVEEICELAKPIQIFWRNAVRIEMHYVISNSPHSIELLAEGHSINCEL
jgi:hypothetical protein